jgi:hypothetical protein
MTKRMVQIAMFAWLAAAATVAGCSDKNQAPTRNVITDVGEAGQTARGGAASDGRAGSGGNDTAGSPGNLASGGADATAPSAIAGAAGSSIGAAVAGAAGAAGAAGTSAVLPCVANEQGCYVCTQPVKLEQFLNQCSRPGITCQKFDNTRVPK